MDETKVISIEKFKADKSLKDELRTYQEYLTYLDTHQLEIEVNHYLLNLNQVELNNQDINKFQFLLEEIATRTTAAFSKSIDLIKNNLIKKIHQIKNQSH